MTNPIRADLPADIQAAMGRLADAITSADAARDAVGRAEHAETAARRDLQRLIGAPQAAYEIAMAKMDEDSHRRRGNYLMQKGRR